MKEINYEKALEKMRKKYKRKPFKEALEHALWMKRDDKLYKMYEEYKDVYLKGQVYYAVSSLLTTDLTVAPSDSEEEDSGEIKTQFTEVNEKVTAKEVVNLRNIPSTTSEDSIVVAQLTKGEVIVRTGVNTDVGWSRVEYNGQVLYCVSSYLEVVEE